MATDAGNGVIQMTAVVLREQAKSARVTGTAGALVVAIAFAMMVIAAPAHSHRGQSGPAGPAVLPAQTVSQVIQAPTRATGPGIRP